MFVEEMVECKKNTQLSLYKDFDQSMYSILVKQKLSLKENMNDKHLSTRQEVELFQ